MQTTTKLVVAGWYAYVGALWSLKGVVVIYYHRIMYDRISSLSPTSCRPDIVPLLTAAGPASRSK
jgi:hypothetical protein